jgi:hypothetical protein
MIGLTSAAFKTVLCRVNFLTFSLYVYYDLYVILPVAEGTISLDTERVEAVHAARMRRPKPNVIKLFFAAVIYECS